jgi:chitinase
MHELNPSLKSSGNQFETYVQSWSPDTMAALQKMNINSSTTIDVSFANFDVYQNGQPSLNGLQMSSQDFQNLINYVHSRGGHVKLSFGGATYPLSQYMNGQPNGLTPGAIAGGIAAIVKQYGLDGVDLDIEDPQGANQPYPQFGQNVLQMLKDLNYNLGPNANISLTIPGQSWAPTSWVGQLFNPSSSSGLQPANQYVQHFNFMEYDLWIDPNGQGQGKPNSYVQQIEWDINYYVQHFHIPASQIMLGLMPGQDDMGQDLTLSQAQQLASFAMQAGLAGVMTWSLNRDYESQDGNSSEAYTNSIDFIFFGSKW